MKRKRLSPAAADEPHTEVSSLVDVSFLLLIFFLVATTITKRETDLTMTIPVEGVPEAVPALPLWIGIAADGSVSLGRNEGEMVVADPSSGSSLDELTTHLRMARDASLPEAIPVVMQVSDGARQQRFIDVLNCLAGVGIENVTMVDESGSF
jgi:biopolymer transport protein ExbD